MKNERKTKAQLVRELKTAHQQVAELRQTRELLAIIFQNVSDLVFLIRVEPGPRFRYLAVNPVLLKSVGITEQEVVGKSVDDILPPEEVSAITENYTRALLAREPITYKEQRNLPAGQQMFETTLTPVLNGQGECTHLLGISINITEQKKAESALRESEARYRSLFDNALEGVFCTTPAGCFLDANPALVRMLGYSSIEEVLALKIPDDLYVEPAQRQRLRDAYEQTGAIAGVELLWKKKTGEPITVSLYARTICDAHGDVIAYEGLVLDMTEQKRAQAALRESEERYRLISQSISDYAFSYRFDEDGIGWLDWITESFSKISGYAVEELLGKPSPWTRYIHPDDLDRVAQAIKSLESGKPVSYECRLITKAGDIRWIEFHVKPVVDESERVLRIYGAARDVTARKQTEETLYKHEQEFKTLVENSPDIISRFDKDMRHVYVSPAIERATGLSPHAFIGKTHREVGIEEKYWRPWHTHLHEVFATGRTTVMEFEYPGPDGTRYFQARFAPEFAKDGSVEYVLGTARDMTEQARAQKERQQLQAQLFQAQKLEAVGTLAGGLAHDLNNMLSAVVGFTELALDEVPPESGTYRNLEEVLKASFRAKALIQQLLTFSCSGPQDREPLAMLPIIEETLRFVRVSLPPSIAVSSSCMDPETKIWGNPSQLQQMVMNLCMNAVHAMEEKHGGTLTVSLQRIEADEALCRTVPQLQPGIYAHLSVQDTGTGMTPEVAERIFEPFFTTKPIGKGSGLGLAIVHGIVTSLKGAIAVESQPGEGTTVHTYFPLIADDILPAQSSSSSSDSGKGAYPYDAHSGY
jgi:two-component system cell cycle sensor histidine kinase/response regulator CckA